MPHSKSRDERALCVLLSHCLCAVVLRPPLATQHANIPPDSMVDLLWSSSIQTQRLTCCGQALFSNQLLSLFRVKVTIQGVDSRVIELKPCFFLFTLFVYLLCARTRQGACVDIGGQLVRICSLLLPRRAGGSNSGCLAWQQAPLTCEPALTHFHHKLTVSPGACWEIILPSSSFISGAE